MFGNRRDITLLLYERFAGMPKRVAAEAAFAAFWKLTMLASTQRDAVDVDHHRMCARINLRDEAVETDEMQITAIGDRIGTGDAFAAGVLHRYAVEKMLAVRPIPDWG